jgi:predicted molibdopterin-dependent oxidoreductase YjgC
VALEPGVNTRAARAFGLDNKFKPTGLEVLYILVGEQDWDGKEILKKLSTKTFLVVQSSYESPLTERAQVVLPMATWTERAGSLTNTDGRVQKVHKAIEPQGDAKPDWEILSLLAEKLGKKLGASLEELSARAIPLLK